MARRRPSHRLLGATILTGLLAITFVRAGLALAAAGDTTADAVLGQPNFTSSTENNSSLISAARLGIPVGVAIDPSGRPWVADSLNNRVLRFKTGGFGNGEPADLVLGQANFTSTACNQGGSPTARTLCFPNSLAFDGVGNLWVSDQSNSRVLFYRNPSANGQAAVLVLGKPNFNVNGCVSDPQGGGVVTSATTLCNPSGLVVKDKIVFVADTSSHRVLRYGPIISNGSAANLVLGQATFTDHHCNRAGSADKNTFCGPQGLALTAAGTLFVSDTSNSRVLQFDAPTQNGQSATNRVLGQSSLVGQGCNSGGLSDKSLCSPQGLALNGSGHLFVADGFNNRVLRYPAPLTSPLATGVFGQFGSFTTNSVDNHGLSANSLEFPRGVAVNSAGNLYVSDTENNRVLRFDNPGSAGSFTLTPPDASVRVHEHLLYTVTWTVPDPRVWRDLQTVDVQIRDDQTILLLRWDEAGNTFRLFDPTSGTFGPAGVPGGPGVLASESAELHLSESSVTGSGPTGQSVTLNLSLSFGPQAAGRTYAVEVAAADDLGNEDDFVQAGTLTVTLGECAADVTARVSVVPRQLRFDRGSNRYLQEVRVRNTSTATIPGPVYLVLDHLSPGTTLANATGVTTCADPLNRPVIVVGGGALNGLSLRETGSVVLEFTSANPNISYTPRVLAGAGHP